MMMMMMMMMIIIIIIPNLCYCVHLLVLLCMSFHHFAQSQFKSLSPYAIPSCYSLVDGFPTAIDFFSSCVVHKIFLPVVRNVRFLGVAKNGGIGYPNRILRDTGTELYETDETRTVPGEPRDYDS
jgi:hypothetical protein